MTMCAAISKKLWFGHFYLGIAIALPLLIIAASGIVLSFHDDLRYTAPPYRLASPVYRSLDADTLAKSVRHHYPRHRLEVLFLPTAPEHSARVKLAGPEPLLVFVDPGTTAILAAKDATDLDGLDWLRELHCGSALGLPGKIAASMAGLGTLFLWLMGLWLWYKLSATAKQQRRRAKFFPRLVTIHRQTGLLLGGAIAVLALLGALLNFAGPLMQWLDPPPAIVMPTSTQQLTTLPLPRLVDAAVNGYRNSPLERVYFPAATNQPWRFRFLDGSWGFVDGQNGTLLKLKTPSSHWANLLYPLHSGKLLGMSGHWLSVFFGLALVLLVGSGLRHSLPIIKPRYHRGSQQQNTIRSDV